MKHFIARVLAIVGGFLASASIAFAAGEIGNPLKVGTISDFVSMALKVLVMVALPIISLFIVYSGFMFVIARGNEGMLNEAKKNFFYVILGSILVLGAWVIATLIGGTAAQLTNS